MTPASWEMVVLLMFRKFWTIGPDVGLTPPDPRSVMEALLEYAATELKMPWLKADFDAQRIAYVIAELGVLPTTAEEAEVKHAELARQDEDACI